MPGLRRLEEDTAGLVKREEGCDVECPFSLWETAAAILGASLEVIIVWTGVAVPELPTGISNSRHFLTKLLAREASCLSVALRRSSLMCLPSRVAFKTRTF